MYVIVYVAVHNNSGDIDQYIGRKIGMETRVYLSLRLVNRRPSLGASTEFKPL